MCVTVMLCTVIRILKKKTLCFGGMETLERRETKGKKRKLTYVCFFQKKTREFEEQGGTL